MFDLGCKGICSLVLIDFKTKSDPIQKLNAVQFGLFLHNNLIQFNVIKCDNTEN